MSAQNRASLLHVGTIVLTLKIKLGYGWGQQPLSQSRVTAVTVFAQWCTAHAAGAMSLQSVSVALGMKLMARSARAVMVRLGFTPRLTGKTDPSQIYMLR